MRFKRTKMQNNIFYAFGYLNSAERKQMANDTSRGHITSFE